jgi:hypothetical protein
MAIAINIKTKQASVYTNYPLIALGKIGNQVIGMASDGLYLMDGDDDNGTPIDASYLSGPSDISDNHLKRCSTAFVGYSATGSLKFVLNGEGGNTEREYDLYGGLEDGFATQRVRPGKGLLNRYWQYGFKNVDGSDFTIDTLELGLTPTSRKTRRYNQKVFTVPKATFASDGGATGLLVQPSMSAFIGIS